MTELRFINLSFVLLILFFAAFTVRAQPIPAPDIRGRVTKINRSDVQQTNLPGSILVERNGDASGKYDKADVKITAQTLIFNQTDTDKLAPLKIDAFKTDQRVEVRFASGPALLTYPIQIGAAEIVILSDAPQTSGGSQNVAASPKNPIPN